MKHPTPSPMPGQADLQPIIQALNTGQVGFAESAAKKLLKSYPRSFPVLNLYGNALAAQNKFKDAVSVFRKATEIDPNVPEITSTWVFYLTI